MIGKWLPTMRVCFNDACDNFSGREIPLHND